jgi:hypothetical protein
MLLILVANLTAAEPGFYDPNRVAAASAQFARYAEVLQPNFETMQNALIRAGNDVEELDLGVSLMGDRASKDLLAYRADLRKQYARQGLEAATFSDWIQDASTQVFMSALEIAIADLADTYDVTECSPASGGIASMTGPGASGGSRSCDGTDLNAQLAASMDANPSLVGVVDQLLAEEWPTVGLSGAEQKPVKLTGKDGYVRLAPLVQALAGDQITKLDDDLDRSLGDLDRDLQGSEDDARAALERGEALRVTYESELAALGETVLGAIEKPLDKAGVDIGVCANPVALGGCTGTDRTDEVIALVKDNKKVLKALD